MKEIFDPEKRKEKQEEKALTTTRGELENFLTEMETMDAVKTLASQAKGDTEKNKLIEKELISENLANALAQNPVIYARLSIIIDEILKGTRTFEICTRYSSEWNLAYTTIQQMYIPKAKKLLKMEIADKEEEMYEDIISKYNNLYKIAMKNRDYKEAKFIMDSISRYTSIINRDGQTKVAPITTVRLIAAREEPNE